MNDYSSLKSLGKPKAKRKSKAYDNDGNTMSEPEICMEAFEQSAAWEDYYSQPIQTGRENKRFIYVDSWDSRTRASRTQKGKMCIEINMVRTAQRKLIAEQRSIDAQVEIIPTNAMIPSKIVELKAGLLRQIAYQSRSKLVYSSCFRDCIDVGYGGIHLVVRRSKDGTLNEDIYFEGVQDVFTCYWDPKAKSPFKEDGQYAGLYIDMPIPQFKQMFPGKTVPTNDLAPMFNNGTFCKDSVRILMHYKRKYRQISVYILQDGTQLTENQYKEINEQYDLEIAQQHAKYDLMVSIAVSKGIDQDKLPEFKPMVKPLPPIKSTEKSFRDYICCYLMTKDDILSERDYETDELPLYYCDGDSVIIDGVQRPIPYSIDAQAPQQMANYCMSEIADDINNRFRPKIIGTKQNFAAHTDQWNNPDRYNSLTYSPDPLTQMPPSFVSPPSFDQMLLTVYQQSLLDIDNVLGVTQKMADDASGTAMLTNEMQSANVKGVYPDNLNMCIAQANRGALKLMPTVYDTERTVTVRGQDGKLDYEVINKNMYELTEDGEMRIENDMSQGEFSVEVYGGSSFAAQRIMAVNFLTNLIRLDTEAIMPLTIDILAMNTPFLFSNKLAERFRDKLVPPDVIAQEEGKPAPPQKPSPEAELAKAEIAIKMKELSVREDQLKADIIQSVSKMIIDMQQTQAKNIQSAASVESAAIKAQSEMGEKFMSSVEALVEHEQKTIEGIENSMQNMVVEPQ